MPFEPGVLLIFKTRVVNSKVPLETLDLEVRHPRYTNLLFTTPKQHRSAQTLYYGPPLDAGSRRILIYGSLSLITMTTGLVYEETTPRRQDMVIYELRSPPGID